MSSIFNSLRLIRGEKEERRELTVWFRYGEAGQDTPGDTLKASLFGISQTPSARRATPTDHQEEVLAAGGLRFPFDTWHLSCADTISLFAS